MARELSERGYRVTGIDGSEEMIRMARENAPRANFVIADVREFALKRQFDCAMASFNSLAHAANVDELRSILRDAHAALKSRGVLLFDLSMEEAYLAKWSGAFGGANDDVAWIIRPSYDPQCRIAKNNCTVFRHNDGHWAREDFTIHQQCFTEVDVRAALAAAGFSEVASYDAGLELGMKNENGRRFFVCS
jgi:SAM-dependent methyltransferase